MKARHVGLIPEGKQRCYKCEGWGVTHYSADEIGKAVTCSVCDGEGLRDLPPLPPPPVYKTAEDYFQEWLADQGISPDSPDAELAERAWMACLELYDDGL